METYLVGGAVRDELLGLPVAERDWVVVGARPDELIEAGFRPVGKDFPVYLHPRTGEEYALARTERRTGRGHRAFECETEAVTLEQDLSRRDLTINAIARTEDGDLVDPVGGLDDLEARRLRHVSPAFREDPLRILRVARFAAQLRHLGFFIDEDTLVLMRDMVSDGELADLTPERVQLELGKALSTRSPAVFFEVIAGVGGDDVLWPELEPQGIELLSAVAPLTEDTDCRLAATLFDIPLNDAATLLRRLRYSHRWIEFLTRARAFEPMLGAQTSASDSTLVDTLYEVDAFRQRDRFEMIVALAATISVARGDDNAEAQARWWRELCDELARLDRSDVDPELSGRAVGDAIRSARIARVPELR